MSNPAKFYRASEAADRFGVDRRTINRWVKSGKIKAIVTPGGHSRIFSSELNDDIKKNIKFKPTSKAQTTILIVDDEASVRNTLKQKLTRRGYVVETASDGFKAGLKARDSKPDLIILDLMMSGIDGFEVCKTIKSNNLLKNTKILIMTGFDNSKNRERANREGADDYLVKGVDFSIVLKRIKDLLPT